MVGTELSVTETTASKTDTRPAVMELLVSWGWQTKVITHVCDYGISAMKKYIMQFEDQRSFFEGPLKDMVNLIPNVDKESIPAPNREIFLGARPGNREQVVKKHDHRR